jgi:hypothetical protein
MLAVFPWRLPLNLLEKPQQTARDHGELYQHEYLMIDSTSTVMSSCGTCHNLSTTHGNDRATLSGGVGISGPGFSFSATIDENLDLNMNGQAGINGLVATISSTHISNPGPRIVVTSGGNRTVQTSGSSTSTEMTRIDNTRGG